MKPLIFITTFSLLIFSATQPKLYEAIKAFKSGNISTVTDLLDNSVQITLNGNTNSYNKQQAATLISDFFRNNKILDFKVLHQSESNETAFCIGNLSTSTGTYRLTFFAKEKNGKTVLQELRFEK